MPEPNYLGIVRGDFGKTYQIIVKNINYNACGAKIYIRSPSGTMLVDGITCSVEATDGSKNTLVKYTPISGAFGIKASYYRYNCRIQFSGAGLRDSTEKFFFNVEEEYR